MEERKTGAFKTQHKQSNSVFTYRRPHNLSFQNTKGVFIDSGDTFSIAGFEDWGMCQDSFTVSNIYKALWRRRGLHSDVVLWVVYYDKWRYGRSKWLFSSEPLTCFIRSRIHQFPYSVPLIQRVPVTVSGNEGWVLNLDVVCRRIWVQLRVRWGRSSDDQTSEVVPEVWTRVTWLGLKSRMWWL